MSIVGTSSDNQNVIKYTQEHYFLIAPYKVLLVNEEHIKLLERFFNKTKKKKIPFDDIGFVCIGIFCSSLFSILTLYSSKAHMGYIVVNWIILGISLLFGFSSLALDNCLKKDRSEDYEMILDILDKISHT
jgi:hypothetical protein